MLCFLFVFSFLGFIRGNLQRNFAYFCVNPVNLLPYFLCFLFSFVFKLLLPFSLFLFLALPLFLLLPLHAPLCFNPSLLFPLKLIFYSLLPCSLKLLSSFFQEPCSFFPALLLFLGFLLLLLLDFVKLPLLLLKEFLLLPFFLKPFLLFAFFSFLLFSLLLPFFFLKQPSIFQRFLLFKPLRPGKLMLPCSLKLLSSFFHEPCSFFPA